jgi:hypothetical protein
LKTILRGKSKAPKTSKNQKTRQTLIAAPFLQKLQVEVMKVKLCNTFIAMTFIAVTVMVMAVTFIAVLVIALTSLQWQ